MGRFLFVTWDGGGNVPPVLALAERLVERGHAATVLGPAHLGADVRTARADFLPRRDDEWEAGVQAAEVVDAVAMTGAEVAVVDYMLPGALCGALASPAATVALVHTLYAANLAGSDLGPMAMAASAASVNPVRAAHGHAPILALGDLLTECDRVLVTAPQELDERAASLAANVRYVGPVLLTPGPDEGWTPPGREADGPVIVVSLGTTPMDEGPVLQRVLDGLSGEDVRVVATVGSHLDPADLAVPANVTISGLVRHGAVLPFASLVVTHAGLGTVLAALSHGIPLVCLPLGREQPANANAAERIGAGLVLEPSASAAVIADAVRIVLSTPRYAVAAAAMSEVLAGLRMASTPERALEELLS